MSLSGHSNKTIVLDLRDSPWTDGPGRTILDCAQDIDQNNYSIIIGSFKQPEKEPSDYVQEAKRRGLKTEIFIDKSTLDFSVIGQLKKAIKHYKADIIHSHEFRSNLFGLMVAKLTRKPIITTTHGWIQNSTKSKIFVRVDKFLLRFFNKVIVVSLALKKLCLAAGVPENKIVVIQNALRTEQYILNKTEQAFRKELGLAQDKILAAYIGRLSPEKGAYELLLAAAEIIPQYPQLIILLIGIGPEEQRLRAFVAANKLEDNVKFLGYRKDMLNVYNSIDLVIQSSYTEGMPNVILEALLCEVPVIATDVGGTNEIVEHDSNGILLPNNIKDVLANAILDFIQHRDKHISMAKKGRTKILANHDHQTRVKKLEQVYQQIHDRR